jgi:PEGA domain-containing protein
MRTFIILALLVSIARADTTDDARKYFEAGKQAYEAGRYTAAISAFEEAHKLAPRPSVMFALAQAYRRQYSVDREGKGLVRAGELYRAYLGAVAQGERRDEATRYLGEIEPLLLEIERARVAQEAAAKAAAAEAAAASADTAAPPPAPAPVPPPPPPPPTQLMISSQTKGTRGAIDGGALSDIPVIADVKPGHHTVHVEADGYFPGDAEATAVDGRLVVAELNLKEKPAQLVVAAPAGADISVDGHALGHAPLAAIALPAGVHVVEVAQRGRTSWSREITLHRGQRSQVTAKLERTTQRTVAWGVLGGAGALALAGGVTAVMSLSARSSAGDLADTIHDGQASVDDLAEHNRLADRANRLSGASELLVGGAAAVAVAGVMLYVLDTPRSAEHAIVPTVSASGAGAVWIHRF